MKRLNFMDINYSTLVSILLSLTWSEISQILSLLANFWVLYNMKKSEPIKIDCGMFLT